MICFGKFSARGLMRLPATALGILLFFFTSSCGGGLSDQEKKRQEERSYTRVTSLFNKNVQRKIRQWDCQSATTHLPYLSLVYNDSINIWTHEVIQKSQLSLTEFIQLKSEVSGLTPGEVYNGNRLPQMDYDYLTADDSVYSSLIFSYDGTLISTTAEGDSILHYELDCKTVAIHESVSAP